MLNVLIRQYNHEKCNANEIESILGLIRLCPATGRNIKH
jgi:hypothetical protein